MKDKYSVTLWFEEANAANDHDTRSSAFILKGTVEFSCDPNQYGNGYSMFIEGLDEPFGGQGYDIRYDKTFLKESRLLYITRWYTERKNYRKGIELAGIKVHEVEEE